MDTELRTNLSYPYYKSEWVYNGRYVIPEIIMLTLSSFI